MLGYTREMQMHIQFYQSTSKYEQGREENKSEAYF